MTEADEVVATGMLYTHWDCGECYEANEAEGDAEGDVLECADCGTMNRIRRV